MKKLMQFFLLLLIPLLKYTCIWQIADFAIQHGEGSATQKMSSLIFRSDVGQGVEGLPTEGDEITCFHLDDNGLLQIADDDLLEDPAIISAIEEETEFNALVEEEAALLDSLLGKG